MLFAGPHGYSIPKAMQNLTFVFMFAITLPESANLGLQWEIHSSP